MCKLNLTDTSLDQTNRGVMKTVSVSPTLAKRGGAPPQLKQKTKYMGVRASTSQE